MPGGESEPLRAQSALWPAQLVTSLTNLQPYPVEPSSYHNCSRQIQDHRGLSSQQGELRPGELKKHAESLTVEEKNQSQVSRSWTPRSRTGLLPWPHFPLPTSSSPLPRASSKQVSMKWSSTVLRPQLGWASQSRCLTSGCGFGDVLAVQLGVYFILSVVIHA